MQYKSYQDLEVWKKAIDMVDNIYELTEHFPQREFLGLAAHIRKTAVSIPSNIAEGCARHSSKEFTQFLRISRGSCAELQTQLLIAQRRKYLKKDAYIEVSKQLNEIGKMTNGLITYLSKSGRSPKIKNSLLTTNN